MHINENQINKWMPLIRKLSQRFQNRIAGFEDLVNEGIVALMNGMNTFTPDKAPIEGYLKNAILKGIYNAAINTTFAVHVPSGSMRLLDKNEKTLQNLKGINIGYIDSCNEEKHIIYDNIQFEDDHKDEVLDVKDIIEKHDRDEIAHLYFFEGLNYEEIASKNNCSLATISRHITSIREMITEKCE